MKKQFSISFFAVNNALIRERTLIFGVFFALLCSAFFFPSPSLANSFSEGDRGMYVEWIDSSLESTPDEYGELQNSNVVKQANSLTTEEGEKVLHISDKKIGIGTQTPRGTLDIQSEEEASLSMVSTTDTASVLIGNAIMLLTGEDFSLSFSTAEIKRKDGEMGNLQIEKNGIIGNNITIKNKNVVLSDQDCDEGEFVSGTDEEGNIICAPAVRVNQNQDIPFCNVNDLNVSSPIRVLGGCKMGNPDDYVEPEPVVDTTDIPFCNVNDEFGSSPIRKLGECKMGDPVIRIQVDPNLPKGIGQCDNSAKNSCLSGTSYNSLSAGGYDSWYCLGDNGGTMSERCEKESETIAQCNELEVNGCTTGVAKNSFHFSGNTYWNCYEASSDDTSPRCRKPDPVDGECYNEVKNTCTAGNRLFSYSADGTDFWYCSGENGGKVSEQCSKVQSADEIDTDTIPYCNVNDDTASSSITTLGLCKFGEGEDKALVPQNGQCDNVIKEGCSVGSLLGDTSVSIDGIDYWYCGGENGGGRSNQCSKVQEIDITKKETLPFCNVNTEDGSTAVTVVGKCKIGDSSSLTPSGEPQAGVCYSQIKNTCITGTSINQTNADGVDYWYCEGENGGDTSEQCSKAIEKGGECDNTTKESCFSGNPFSSTTLNGYDYWYCSGENGGAVSEQCKKYTPVDGQCNEMVKDSCAIGTATGMTSVDGVDYWYCSGKHGGNESIQCKKTIPINGECNNLIKNSCATGERILPYTYDGVDYWYCSGEKGGVVSEQCQKESPVVGVCDESVKNTCLSGEAININLVNGYDTWYCSGSSGGDMSGLCRKEEAKDGVCDESVKNGCSVGNRLFMFTEGDYNKWYCDGENGGSLSEVCSRHVPIAGECNNQILNTCTVGSATDILQQDGYDTWSCIGPYDGAKDLCKKVAVIEAQVDTPECTVNTENGKLGECELKNE